MGERDGPAASAAPGVGVEPVGVEPARAPAAPTSARAIFGDRLATAQAYADALATDGVLRGLIGPREVPRLWDRHLVNCAVLGPILREGDRVADVGSGAGLPGLVVAMLRPDVELVLVEPLLRRTGFLEEMVETLALGNVTVRRARAEECRDLVGTLDAVVARAVAPLDRLAGWTVPLLRPGGRLLALKGGSAAEELRAAEDSLRALGAATWSVRVVDFREATATMIEVVSGAPPARRAGPPGRQQARQARRPR